ncbi:MAG: S1C family serine protease [Clostridia bacterium]
MEENKTNQTPNEQIIEGEIVQKEQNSNKESTYTAVKAIGSDSNKESSHFGRNVVLPFFSGILGTAVVIGTCFGIPSIRESLLGTQPNTNTNNSTLSSQNSGTPSSTNLVSLANYSDTGISVAEKVRPSIVGITVEYSVSSVYYKGLTGTSKAEGSGIIISEDGYILTNNHIVNSTNSSSSSYYEVGKANKVTVFLYNDETEYEGTIIGTDEQTDLAVIKIEKTGLTAAELGDSDNVKVGEFAMAIGNPLGMQSSVSAGMISALNRKITSDGVTFNLIQTDAAINAGNSGGALVNADGQVIGINTLKASGTGVEGMGFAIPINSAKPIYEQLIQYQKVKRPYIGISGRDLDEETAKANNLVVGIYVASVEDFSAGQKAGLKIGDVIIEADGKKITTMDELNAIKNNHNIGDEMKLKINRNGSEKEVTLILQEQ